MKLNNLTINSTSNSQFETRNPQSLIWLPTWALWWRDVARFLRQRNRIIGALATPLVFWLLLGAGLSPSFRPPGMDANMSYFAYFFPGTIVLIMLFTAIFSTISVIEDRREGFLQSVLVAPVHPVAIVLGKYLGGTTLAFLQGVLFLILAPFAGVSVTAGQLVALLIAFILVGFAMTGLGFLIAWPMESTQGFHAIMNIFLMPLWMLSGALFPAVPGSGWLWWVYVLNPVSYCVAAVRTVLGGDAAELPGLPPYGVSITVTAIFAIAMFGVGWFMVTRRRNK